MKILIIGMPEGYKKEVEVAILAVGETALFDNTIYIKQKFAEVDAVVFCSENNNYVDEARICEHLRIPYLFCLWEGRKELTPFVILLTHFSSVVRGNEFISAVKEGRKPQFSPDILLDNYKSSKLIVDNSITSETTWTQVAIMLEQKI